MPKIISIIGRSGSGKTTLITRLIPLFCEAKLKVGTIKHTHHQLEFDQPGKDSWKHSASGASQVLLMSGDKIAVYTEAQPQQPLSEIVHQWFPDFDLVICEGFKNQDCLKIEVYRQSNLKPPLYLDPTFDIQAVISDTPPPQSFKHFNLKEVKAIYSWITGKLDLPA